MHSEFEMSMMGELNFFLGLQIKQLKEGTFINQAKYIRDLLKMFNMEEAKTMKTPMSSSIKLDNDEKGFSFISVHLRLLVGLHPLSFGFSFISVRFLLFFVLWMAPRRETGTSRAQGKRPAEPSQPEQTEARRKASCDDFEPIFPTLVGILFTGDLWTWRTVMSTVYEAKAWPTVPGFEPREAIQRLCGLADAQGMANHRHIA
ncbi:hypothetical protein CK203_048484 [Vitis vinifera]|uniref:Reverse transcriptase Ty1/copia-type domain-containing protein n=1 Tax=Vitis vinifera TaxID=29760 RepID=A0A438FXC7_VITVI|nr:hypothetical protein CK203_048484 [Vitis vinifera]